jgi:hypothetical protein
MVDKTWNPEVLMKDATTEQLFAEIARRIVQDDLDCAYQAAEPYSFEDILASATEQVDEDADRINSNHNFSAYAATMVDGLLAALQGLSAGNQ